LEPVALVETGVVLVITMAVVVVVVREVTRGTVGMLELETVVRGASVVVVLGVAVVVNPVAGGRIMEVVESVSTEREVMVLVAQMGVREVGALVVSQDSSMVMVGVLEEVGVVLRMIQTEVAAMEQMELLPSGTKYK
jgi:hypothetical protein